MQAEVWLANPLKPSFSQLSTSPLVVTSEKSSKLGSPYRKEPYDSAMSEAADQ
jgi:hypothetical protein